MNRASPGVPIPGTEATSISGAGRGVSFWP